MKTKDESDLVTSVLCCAGLPPPKSSVRTFRGLSRRQHQCSDPDSGQQPVGISSHRAAACSVHAGGSSSWLSHMRILLW